MFAPLAAKVPAKTEAGPAARRREALVVRPFDGDGGKAAQSIEASAREAPRGVAWDFSKVSVSPPDLAEAPQRQVVADLGGPELVASRRSFPLSPGPGIQAKLRVSDPDDPEEQQADQLAGMLTAEGEALDFADRAAITPEPGPVSQSADWWDEVHRAAADHTMPDTSDSLYGRLQTRLGHGTELPDGPKASMESGFGANFGSVRVHVDRSAAELNQALRAFAFTFRENIFFAAGQFDPHSRNGKRLLAHELAHVLQQRGSARDQIHRQAAQPARRVSLTFTVTLYEPASGQEFFARAVMQYFQIGRPEAEQKIRAGKVTCTHPVFLTGVTPDLVGKPIAVSISTAGMSSGEKAAAARRTAAINALPAADRKEINDETDLRFWHRYEYKPGQPLTRGASEEGMRQAWLRTREGVIADQESVARLSPQVQSFLTSGGKRKIRPEDYKTVLRIATKLEAFSEEDWALYNRRVTASTDDLEKVEKSVELFQARQAGEKRVIDRLSAREGLYQQVKAFKALNREMLTPRGKPGHLPINDPGNKERFDTAKSALDVALQAGGFASIEDFDAATAAFVVVFRQRAVEIALLVLRTSEQAITAERRRYEQPAEVDQLFDQLAGTRSATREAGEAFRAALPTAQQLKMDSTRQTPSQIAATSRYRESTARAEQERGRVAEQYPILKDPELRTGALNVADSHELAAVLRGDADDRLADIQKTRVNLLGDNDVIFKLNRIVELTRQELRVTPGSVYEMAIQDYRDQIAITELVIQLATGALAIGLGLLTFGGGTVAVLAGGAALGLSVYQAGAEWEKYSAGTAAAHTSFNTALSVSSEDPSAVWAAIALIGVGLEGAALVSAFKAAKPAAEILKTTRNVAQFDAELAKAAELSEAMKSALSRSARAENDYQTAVEELAEAWRQRLGNLYSGGISPDVINKAVNAAYYSIKRGVANFEVFLQELKVQKFARGIDFNSLTAEQLQALRNAFKTAEGQVASDAARFSVSVPFKAGQKVVTFDETGKMLLDGKAVTDQQYKEIYKALDLTHVIGGHGPNKPLIEVMNETKLLSRGNPGLAGRFASDERLLQAVEQAKAQWQAIKQEVIYLEALPNAGRAFARADKVPSGAQLILPFDAPPGVVELQVRRIRAVFRSDGSLVTIFPVGF